MPVSTSNNGSALSTTLEQIEIVKAMCQRYPETFELALSTKDIDRIRKAGKIASMIGVEGGHSIENSLNVLRQLHRQGARYMTLTHSQSLDWADSCSDEARCAGLSAFGEQVVREMNRLGMLVDISHVSADCMRHVLRITKAPVIFSHSSARSIADHPRNVPDDVLNLTAQNGGVVMINFFNDFVNPIDARRSLQHARSATIWNDDSPMIRSESMRNFADGSSQTPGQLPAVCTMCWTTSITSSRSRASIMSDSAATTTGFRQPPRS